MRVLLLDIETAPNIAYVWSLWKENIPLERIIESGYMLTWAAKWAGDSRVFSRTRNHRNMLPMLHALLDEADMVVHYNGMAFDIPHINREFLLAGFVPPSPYRQLDLLQVVKKSFRFPSNKLQYVAGELGLGSKVKHDGFGLWVRCMNNDEEAWKQMLEYNIQDVHLLESLYDKLAPWSPNPINQQALVDEFVCPSCGSVHVEKRGFYYPTKSASKYQRYHCTECGKWSRGNQNLNELKQRLTEI